MPRGGARVNSGPPPDPNALRRDRPSDKDGWTLLPSNGRSGDAPAWPLIPDVRLSALRDIALGEATRLADELAQATTGRERASVQKKLATANKDLALLDRQLDAQRELEQRLWSDVWSTPQSVVWERQGWVRDVAQYVRHKVLGELGDLDQAKEARQWSDRLGLNPAAMLRNRWKIAPDEVTERRTASRPAATRSGKRTSARDRFKVVRDGGA